ncbi:hypothetical protein WN943_016029 [Citrus x changshan-huyou]
MKETRVGNSCLVEIVLFKLILSAVRGVGRNPAVFSPLLKKADDLAFLENEYALASLEKIGSGGEDKMFTKLNYQDARER